MKMIDVTGLDLPHPVDGTLYRPITHTEMTYPDVLVAAATMSGIARAYTDATRVLLDKMGDPE